MIELTLLAGPIGLVGLALALVLWRRNRAAATASSHISTHPFLKQAPLIAGVVVLLAALIWLTVALPTALAFSGGAILSMAVGVSAARAIDGEGLWAGSTHGGVDGARRPLTVALSIGVAVASIGSASLGLLYFTLAHAPAAFLQSELVNFGNIVGGFALGVSTVALLLAVCAGSFAGAAGAAGASPIHGARAPAREPGDGSRRIGGVGGAVGSTIDLLQSYLGASIAAIVIAGAGSIFTGQRVEAVALPILVGSVGLLSTVVAALLAGALKGAHPARVLRSVGLLATGLFLLLSYFVVIALEMEGRDPFTGRDYLPSGPFWALLAGSLGILGAGFATEFYTSWRPAWRLAQGPDLGLGPTILWAISLGMESVLIPTVLVGTAAIAAYFFAGAYGVAMGAVGALATVGITVGTVAFGPAVSSSEVGVDPSERGQPPSTEIGLVAVAASGEAIARGVAVTASAMTSLALLAGYSHATGLWGIGIDLQSPLLLAGLLIGGAMPLVIAALVFGVGRRAEGPHLAAKIGLPLLLAIALPLAVGYLLGVHSIAGLLAGCTLSGLLVGLFLANSGSALVNTGIFVAANGTTQQVHQVGAASGGLGRALRDGVIAVTVVVKLVGVLSIVLVPWFVQVF